MAVLNVTALETQTWWRWCDYDIEERGVGGGGALRGGHSGNGARDANCDTATGVINKITMVNCSCSRQANISCSHSSRSLTS